MGIEAATLEFDAQGTPWSPRYGDVYHAAAGGPSQAEHVFIHGNGLPERWQNQTRFTILETGFGLGLNFLATWAAWQADPKACQRLHFISVEKHPFTASDLLRAHRQWPQFAELAAELHHQWPPLLPGIHRLNLAGGRVILTLVFGDAVEQLTRLDAGVDAFYLDGFSPAQNPELWSEKIARALARLARPGASLATWSVAGSLRQALTQAEFEVSKAKGFADKRHMLTGRYRSRKPDRYAVPTDRRAIVIGAGAAGSCAANRLAARGWEVTVLDRRPSPGLAASGNHIGMFRPLPSLDDNRLSRLTRAGFLATHALLRQMGDQVRWGQTGVLQVAKDADQEALQQEAVTRLAFPSEFLQFVDRASAAQLTGYPTQYGGWWFPSAGWIQPPSLCRGALAAYPEQIRFMGNTLIRQLQQDEAGIWSATDASGNIVARAPTVVIAAGAEVGQLTQLAQLPQLTERGQVTHLPQSCFPRLNIVVCGSGYATPPLDGQRVIGATHDLNDVEGEETIASHAENLVKIARLLTGAGMLPQAEACRGKVGFRPISPDRLPIVGAVPVWSNPKGRTRLHDLRYQPGLWCVQGFGTRGLAWAALMGELIASRIDGDPLPLETDLADALSPGRFLLGQTIP